MLYYVNAMEVQGMNVEGIVRIANAKVYGLRDSLIASRYPMAVNYCEDMNEFEFTDKMFEVAGKLGKAKPGSGHDCYLKGITVQFDLQCPEYIWRQMDRYHFRDYVSSQSKMHMILKFDTDKMSNKYVTEEALANLNRWVLFFNDYEFYNNHYKNNPGTYHDIIATDEAVVIKLRNGEVVPFNKEEIFRMIIANCPCGFMLTARITTNYLQLKSIINQRANHKMHEWHYITDWMKGLPGVDELVLK